jgi:hypothetical protein
MRRGLVGDDVGADAARDHVPGRSRRHCRAGRPRRLPCLASDRSISSASSSVSPSRRHSGCAGGNRCGSACTRPRGIEAPAMVAASGCAPPMPPRPPVRIHLPLRIAVIMLAAGLDEGLVGALHDALRADIDPRAGRHLAVHHQPFLSSSLKCSQVAQCGTRLELAISTRGASLHGCGTRRPACPTAPAASRRRSSERSVATMRSKSPRSGRRGRCRHRPRARGFSATSGSRLFISMRSGASVSQLLAESSVPRGLRMTRLLSRSWLSLFEAGGRV